MVKESLFEIDGLDEIDLAKMKMRTIDSFPLLFYLMFLSLSFVTHAHVCVHVPEHVSTVCLSVSVCFSYEY